MHNTLLPGRPFTGRSGPIGRPPIAAKRCRHTVCELSEVMPMLYATCIMPYDACRTAHAMFRMSYAACRMPHFRAVVKASACAQIRRAKHLNKAFESFSQLLLCIMHYLCTSVNVVNQKTKNNNNKANNSKRQAVDSKQQTKKQQATVSINNIVQYVAAFQMLYTMGYLRFIYAAATQLMCMENKCGRLF